MLMPISVLIGDMEDLAVRGLLLPSIEGKATFSERIYRTAIAHRYALCSGSRLLRASPLYH